VNGFRLRSAVRYLFAQRQFSYGYDESARIPVWLPEQARRLGVSEQELLAAYPALRAEDLVNAWNYARSHAAEIDKRIDANEAVSNGKVTTS
jgi:hypothetical protein